MNIEQTEKIIDKQPAMLDEIPVLRALYAPHAQDPLWAMLRAFTYGCIKGKQAERARRRRQV